MKTDADLRWERRQAETQRRKALRDQAATYKGGKCQICGYDKCSAALEFHHVDPRTKDFTISQRMTTFEAIRRELDKCVLLCANCHREVHDGYHPQYLVYEDSDRGLELDELDLDSDSYEDEQEVLSCLNI
jgi:5-methylcytosine-specific restriction endonuclease McrA